jgi:DNA polymerase III delta subunit
MTVSELKNLLKTQCPNFLIFVGEEVGLMDLYINRVQKLSGLQLRVVEYEELIKGISLRSLFATNYLYVIRNEKDFLEFDHIDKIKNNKVIACFSSLDKRTSFYKKYKNYIVEFETLTDEALLYYLHNQLGLTKENSLDLMNLCDNNYSRIMWEVDKIEEGDVNENYLKIRESIYKEKTDKIFDFIEAIVTKKDSWSMLDTINETDMAIPIIYNLFTTGKEILQVQSCKVDISNRTGINPYKLKHVQRKCGYYTNSQLKEIMRLCLNVDVGIKGGDIPGHIALRYLLINLNKIA